MLRLAWDWGGGTIGGMVQPWVQRWVIGLVVVSLVVVAVGGCEKKVEEVRRTPGGEGQLEAQVAAR